MAEVIDKDLGWERIKKNFISLHTRVIKAGVLESAGNGKNGVSIAYYASCNEYGTYESGSEWQRIPARPFMGMTADEQKMWRTPIINAVDRIIGGANGTTDVKAELSVVGEKMKKDIKNNIGKNKYKPLAPSTIARKGHSIPLMDSGALYDAIDYEVK